MSDLPEKSVILDATVSDKSNENRELAHSQLNTRNAAREMNGVAQNGVQNVSQVGTQPLKTASPKALDAQRARQILDRAFLMSERSDFAGAIVACRQSIALSPNEAASHSMLGFLLERSGDFKGAVTAYEKTLQIAPDSPLERDGLRRLLAEHGAAQNAKNARFQFDENELFDEDASPEPKAQISSTRSATTPSATTPTATTPSAQPNRVAEQNVAQLNRANANVTNANATNAQVANASTVASTASTVAPPRSASPVAQSPVAQSPVATPRVIKPAIKAAPTVDLDLSSLQVPTSQTPIQISTPSKTATPHTLSQNALSQNALSRADVFASSPTNWLTALRAYPTFWTRSLPLMSVAGTGLLWMLWAQNAANRNVDASPTVSQTIIETTTPAVESADTVAVDANNTVADAALMNNAVSNNAVAGTANANPNAIPAATATPKANGLFSSSLTISNKPQNSPSPAASPDNAQNGGRVTNSRTNSRTDSSPNRVRRENAPTSSTRNDNVSAPRDVSRPPETRELAPLPPASLPSSSNLPPAPVTQLPRVPAAPRGSSGASNQNSSNDPQFPPSSDGNNDSGNGGLAPFNGALPQFPNPTTNSQPSIQPSSARPSSGGLNSVNNRDAENAYRYQTRALLHIERGDNAKAIADFQSAISFYKRQIAKGIGVADAQRGLEACRSGLRLVSSR